MNEIDLSELSSVKSFDRLRQIANDIAPGKGISLSEVAFEIGITTTSLRSHAKTLGCYQIVTVKGRPVSFITHLPK